MKSRYQGILIIPIFLCLAIIVGTPEFALENSEPANINEYDLTLRLDNLNALHEDIEDKLLKLKESIGELQPDENIPLSLDLQIHLRNECNKYGVDIAEALAIMLTENSQLNPNAINTNKDGSKDYGLMQINECHMKEFLEMGFTDMKDSKENISYGIYFISTLGKYEGEQKYMAYNMGVGGMKKAVSRGTSSTAYSRKVIKKVRGGL